MRSRPTGSEAPDMLAAKLRAVMPEESTIDLANHSRLLAETVAAARRKALGVPGVQRGAAPPVHFRRV